MPQCNITINLLISSRHQPKLSAHACLYGKFDINFRLLAPTGTKVVIHETVNQRESWDLNGIEGWYSGPDIEHYCCHKWYILSTTGIQDFLTLDWFPKQTPFPNVSTKYYLHQTDYYMLAILSMKKKNIISSLRYASEIKKSNNKIYTFLHCSLPHPHPSRQPTLVP